jgi:DNA repair protein RadC
MSIKLLAEDDRPREKFLLKGAKSLSDSELLAIILKIGHKEETAVELARKILKSVDNHWNHLSKLSVNDLMKFKGIGKVKAVEILSALEIGKRRAVQEIPEKMQIHNSEDVYHLLHPLIADLPTEEFWAIFVNQSNHILHKTKWASGAITGSIIDVRILFKIAIEHFATGIFIAHNHPSGSSAPSRHDREITEHISLAGKTLDIQLLDHIIIAQNSFFSFLDENLL